MGTGALACPGRAQLGRIAPLETSAVFDNKKLTTKLSSRDSLQPGKRYSGPAIITEYSATTVIPPHTRFPC